MSFIRVRSANPADPQHEFDIPEPELHANRDIYTVVDPEPVPDARPPIYADALAVSVPVVEDAPAAPDGPSETPAPVPTRAAAPRRSKPGEKTNPAPSGADS